MKAADVANAKVKMFVTASGEPAQIAAWLIDVRKHTIWKIDADAQANGVRFVRLVGPPDVPYREMGGLIFYAQQRHLSVSFNAEPPICDPEGE